MGKLCHFGSSIPQVNQLLQQIRVLIHDPGRGLADDDEAHDDCLLGAFVGQEIILAQALTKLHASLAACCM
jgi:hypothetical protein